MKNFLSKVKNNQNTFPKVKNVLADVIMNDPESKMRIRIKEIDEIVKKEIQQCNYSAPLTFEEKALLNF